MALPRYDYFYDRQIARYLEQVVRAFSGFQYQTGARGDKAAQLRTVPCNLAKRSKQVAAIQRNMSENTLLSVPMIAVDMTAFEPVMDRLQNPSHAEMVSVTERAINPVTGQYTNERGNSYSIERLMPRPFKMTVQIDIWTSTMDQKLQLMEQIDQIVFPSFSIQNSDHPVDWSAMTTCNFESQSWSSLSVPIGTGDEIDIASIVMSIEMWLTPPAKIYRARRVERIITNVNQGDVDQDGELVDGGTLMTVVTTPGNHSISIDRGYITLLGPSGTEKDAQGRLYSWADLCQTYGGVLAPAETQVRLRRSLDDDGSRDMIGTIQPTDEPNVVFWQAVVDTLPANTLTAVHGVLYPGRNHPGDGHVPPPIEGSRYLLLDDLAGPSLIWGEISARRGAIVEFTGGRWVVKFDATDHRNDEYVTNRMSGSQLRWDVESQSWTMAIGGVYQSGEWLLVV